MTDQKPTSKHVTPTHVDENWSFIHMPNGDVIRIKHVVMGVMQQFDEKGEQAKLPDGSFVYGVTMSNPIIGVVPASEAKAMKKGMN